MPSVITVHDVASVPSSEDDDCVSLSTTSSTTCSPSSTPRAPSVRGVLVSLSLPELSAWLTSVPQFEGLLVSPALRPNSFSLLQLLASHHWFYVDSVSVVPSATFNPSISPPLLGKFLVFRRGERDPSNPVIAKAWLPLNFNHQAVNDVILANNNADALYRMKQKLEAMLPITAKVEHVKRFGAYLQHTKLAKEINRIVKGNEMTDTEVQDLGNEKDLIVEFQDVEEAFPDDAVKEIGYGENTEIHEEFHEKSLIDTAITHKMKEISEATLSSRQHPDITRDMIGELEIVLRRHWKAFGTEESTVRMSDLSPITIRLSDTSPQHISAKGRPLAGKEQQEFLINKLRSLQKLGIVEPAKNPTIGSAAFVVRKKGPAKWRMVVDMRTLNRHTVPTACKLPHLEQQLSFIGNSRFFGSYDALSGFDYLRTHPSSYPYFTIVTSFGCYTMKGAPMGWVNTPALFSNRIMQEILEPAGLLQEGAIQWLDDTLIYDSDFRGYLAKLDKFLTAVEAKKVRLNIRKCDLLSQRIEYCGRVIGPNRWNYLPKFYEKVLELNPPTYVHELAKALYTMNWLSPAIPGLAELRETFADLVALRGGTLKKLEKEARVITWSPALRDAWARLLLLLHKSAKADLTNYSADNELCLFADASEKFWSLVVARTDVTDIEERAVEELCCRPIMYFSGKFQNSSANWHVSSKELWPFIFAFDRLHFLLYGHPKPIHLFTDHKNLIYLLRPEWSEKLAYLNRLRRWILIFQSARLQVHHLPGERNALADIISRWANPEADMPPSFNSTDQGTCAVSKNKEERSFHQDRDSIPINAVAQARSSSETSSKVSTLAATNDMELIMDDLLSDSTSIFSNTQGTAAGEPSVHTIQQTLEALHHDRVSYLNPYYNGIWKPVDIADIRRLQQDDPVPQDAKVDAQGLLRKGSKLWVPATLLPWILIHSHVSLGHTSETQELMHLRKHYSFPSAIDIARLVKEFRRRCLHCDRVPKFVRRPLHLTELARTPREILHSDFLYVDQNSGYILTILDNLTRKTYLKHCVRATAFQMVQGLLEFRGTLGLANEFLLVTDQGSHYCNILLEELSRALRFTHTVTVAYSPWVNGQAEVLNSTVLKYLRSICSEYRLPDKDWPMVLPIVMHLINNKPMARRCNYTPNELFLGLAPNDNLFSSVHLALPTEENTLITPTSPPSLHKLVDGLLTSIEAKAFQVYDAVRLKRTMENNRLNSKYFPLHQFQVGEWVLRSVANTPRSRAKLHLRWLGPFRITKILGDNVYEITDIWENSQTVHAAYLWLYEGRSFQPPAEVKALFSFHWNSLQVHSVVGHRFRAGTLEFLVHWLGFDSVDDTWEPFSPILEAAPSQVDSYLSQLQGETRTSVLNQLPASFGINRLNLQNVPTYLNIIRNYILAHPFATLPAVQIWTSKAGLGAEPPHFYDYGRQSPTFLSIQPKHLPVNAIHRNKANNQENQAEQEATKQTTKKSIAIATIKGWTADEELVLKQCIKKYGFGDYNSIILNHHLPGKNKQQLYTKLQRWTLTQALEQYRGLHADLDDVRKYNIEHFGKELRKRRTKLTSQELQELQKQNYELFSLSDQEVERTTIPYVRRFWRADVRKLAIQEQIYPDEFLTRLKQQDDAAERQRLQGRQFFLPFVKALRKLLFIAPNILDKVTEPSRKQRFKYEGYKMEVKWKEQDPDPGSIQFILQQEAIYNFRFPSQVQIVSNPAVEVLMTDVQTHDKVAIEVDHNNYYTFKHGYFPSEIIFLQPPGSYPIFCDLLNTAKVKNIMDIKISETDRKFEVLLLDPPWRLSGNNPLRGPSLGYRTLSNQDIFGINLSLFQDSGIVAVWIINAVYPVALKWLMDQEYQIINEFSWLKLTSRGNLGPSLGHHLQHATETCILATKGDFSLHSLAQLQLLPTKILQRRGVQSAKPNILHAYLDILFPKAHKLELFGRSFNLRPTWTTIGLQVLPDPSQTWSFVYPLDALDNLGSFPGTSLFSKRGGYRPLLHRSQTKCDAQDTDKAESCNQ